MNTAEDRLQVVRVHFDAINASDRGQWDWAHADPYEAEDSGWGVMNHDQHWQLILALRAAFPNLRLAMARTFECTQAVIVLWTGSGTHTGPLPTAQGRVIAPTNKTATVRGCSTFEFEGGKVSRQLGFFDNGALLAQLGVLP